MPTVTIELPRPHTNQREALASNARFRTLACGRRFGKSTLALIECTERSLKGERIWYCTPTVELARKMYNKLKSILGHWPSVKTNDTYREIELPQTRGYIQFVTLGANDNLRGEGLNFIVVDEAAFVDGDIYKRVLRPMLIDKQGDALFISSPNGFNWFYEMYMLGQSDNADYASWRYSSYDNPMIAASEIDTERATAPDIVFRQEYLAEFVEGSGAVFTLPDGSLYADAPRTPQPNCVYVAGVDWGQSNDYTALSIIEAPLGGGALREVALYRWRQMAWSAMRAEIITQIAAWQCERIVAESNSMGSSQIEALINDFEEHTPPIDIAVNAFVMNNRAKHNLVSEMKNALADGTLVLLDDEDANRELQQYQTKQLPNGVWKYEHPPNSHDDTVDARMLALFGIQSDGYI